MSARHRRGPSRFSEKAALFRRRRTTTHTPIAGSPNWPESVWHAWRKSSERLNDFFPPELYSTLLFQLHDAKQLVGSSSRSGLHLNRYQAKLNYQVSCTWPNKPLPSNRCLLLSRRENMQTVVLNLHLVITLCHSRLPNHKHFKANMTRDKMELTKEFKEINGFCLRWGAKVATFVWSEKKQKKRAISCPLERIPRWREKKKSSKKM